MKQTYQVTINYKTLLGHKIESCVWVHYTLAYSASQACNVSEINLENNIDNLVEVQSTAIAYQYKSPSMPTFDQSGICQPTKIN